jgi:hypothetical protein
MQPGGRKIPRKREIVLAITVGIADPVASLTTTGAPSPPRLTCPDPAPSVSPHAWGFPSWNAGGDCGLAGSLSPPRDGRSRCDYAARCVHGSPESAQQGFKSLRGGTPRNAPRRHNKVSSFYRRQAAWRCWRLCAGPRNECWVRFDRIERQRDVGNWSGRIEARIGLRMMPTDAATTQTTSSISSAIRFGQRSQTAQRASHFAGNILVFREN